MRRVHKLSNDEMLRHLRYCERALETGHGIASEGHRAALEEKADFYRRQLGPLATVPRCDDCGRPLEDPVSIERHYGPDCWAKRQRAEAQSIEDHAAAVAQGQEDQRLEDLDWAEAQAWDDE